MLGQGAEEQQDQQQDDGVDDTGNRGTSAIVDVGHRAGNRSGHRNTTKQRYDHIGRTLGDQLCVGVMFVTCHTISHRSREQRLDRTQDSDREGRGEQQVNHIHIKANRFGLRQ